MIARHAQRDTHDLAARRNTTRSALGERQVRRLDSVQLRYQALETRLAVVEDRLQISRPGPASTATSIADPSVPRGYLMKDVDSFAGFAHAIHTYLAGVALADLHGRRLLYVPFRAAHGLEFAFDDFLTSDPRGMPPPLAAPRLLLGADAQPLIDGRPASVLELTKGKVRSRSAATPQLRAAPARRTCARRLCAAPARATRRTGGRAVVDAFRPRSRQGERATA